jgi:hypothetical protein
MAEFFISNGTICASKEIKKFNRVRKEWEISCFKNQALTANVKNSTFMTEGHGKKMLLRWSKQKK